MARLSFPCHISNTAIGLIYECPRSSAKVLSSLPSPPPHAEIGDTDNARALFERVFSEPDNARSPLLWRRFVQFEYELGNMTAAQQVTTHYLPMMDVKQVCLTSGRTDVARPCDSGPYELSYLGISWFPHGSSSLTTPRTLCALHPHHSRSNSARGRPWGRTPATRSSSLCSSTSSKGAGQ